MDDDDLSQTVADLKSRWQETCRAASDHAQSLRSCGIQAGANDSASLPRLNALAQDCLVTLRSLQRQFELLAQQFESVEGKDACLQILEGWKTEYQGLHSTIRSANLQAKANIQKAVKLERVLLLGGGHDSTNLRRNLQTQAGMSAAAESVTESLRRTRQMMMQELERGANTLSTLDTSTATLKQTESEHKGQRSLLMATRSLLTVMTRQDVLDRIILVIGFIFFCAVVSYIFHQRIGIFKMQRSQVVLAAPKPPLVPSPITTDTPQRTQPASQLQHPVGMRVGQSLAEPEAVVLVGNHPTVDTHDPLPTTHTEL